MCGRAEGARQSGCLAGCRSRSHLKASAPCACSASWPRVLPITHSPLPTHDNKLVSNADSRVSAFPHAIEEQDRRRLAAAGKCATQSPLPHPRILTVNTSLRVWTLQSPFNTCNQMQRRWLEARIASSVRSVRVAALATNLPSAAAAALTASACCTATKCVSSCVTSDPPHACICW